MVILVGFSDIFYSMIRLIFLTIILLFPCSPVFAKRICGFEFSKESLKLERLSNNTIDGLNDYIRYSDATGSRYYNVGVPKNQEFELYVISAKDGKPTVIINKSEKPLILVLASDRVESWTLIVDETAKLKRVYNVGIKNNPSIFGLSENVEYLDLLFYKCDGRLYKNIDEFMPYSWEGDSKKIQNQSFNSFISSMHRKIGLIETSFQSPTKADEILIPFKPDNYKRNDLALDVDFYNWTDQKGLEFYKNKYFTDADPSTRETLMMVVNLMEKQKLPIFYPTEIDTHYSKKTFIRHFSPLKFDLALVHFGKKNNVINIGQGDYLIEAGSGDHEVKEHKTKSWKKNSRTLFVFNKNWGNDTFSTPCKGNNNRNLAQMIGKDFWRQKGFQYNNFLIFGPEVFPEDMKWEEPFLLKNQRTGDSIKFTETSRCGHMIFYEEGKMEPFSWLYFYNKL